MACGLKPLASLKRIAGAIRQPLTPQNRCFSIRVPCLTDGVYSELTAMRTRTPFIEAFKRQQEQKNSSVAAKVIPSKPKVTTDLSPKSMSESYHRVVSVHWGEIGSLWDSD